LCGVHEYASEQFLYFLELANYCIFLDQKPIRALYETFAGHYLEAFSKLGFWLKIKADPSFDPQAY
jgi:hypothetical protein